MEKNLKKLMKDALTKISPEKSKLINENTEFSKVAEKYLKLVPREEQLEMFNNYFVGVELPENRKKFLNNNWPYIYTLNIDDGIENSLKNYEKIMPYKNLNIDYVKTNKCIFKLHGDAKHEIFYKNDENFVLSRKQYLISIRDNYDLLQFIQSDYKSKNILLVGCSLEDEIDLEYAVATNDGFDEAKNNRYFLSEKVPDEDLQEKLEELFVNKIILVERYEDFYQDFFVGSEKKETILSKYRFTGYLSNNDKEDNIDYFLGMQNQKKDGKVIKYESMAERDVEILKINDVFKNNTILVVGPRLSGKTTFLVNMLQKLSSHEVYFFSSAITLSASFMMEICSLTNSVLVFDSNAISPDNTKEFDKIFKSAKANDNKLIVAANKSDKLFMAFYTNLSFDIKIEIDKRPSIEEKNKINKGIEKFGIPKFSKNNFIDNIASLSSSIYKGRKNAFPNVTGDSCVQSELVFLILLASVGKVYYITFQTLGVSVGNLELMIKKFEPAVEIYDSSLIETHMHSGFKAVANSKFWIIQFLDRFAKTKNGQDKIIDAIEEIVKRLYFTKTSSYCAKQVILFDNINAIFSVNDGVAKLPFGIYNRLQNYLNNEPDYWLQRAKSIRILSKNIQELLIAKDYAYKAYLDKKTQGQYSEKAVLTLAMIMGKICSLDNYKNKEWVKNAVDFYYEALNSEKNVIYVDDLLINARRQHKDNDLYCLSKYLFTLSNGNSEFDKRKIDFILNECIFHK